MAAKTLKKVAKKNVSASKPRVRKKKAKEIQDEDVIETEVPHSWGQEVTGLFLIALSLVVLISLVSHFALAGKSNILGPILGTYLASTLNQATGNFPAILMVIAVAALGVKLTQKREENFNFKIPVVAGLLYAWVTILLSVKNIGRGLFGSHDFEASGGYIGNFIVHHALTPLFGKTTFGPYLIVSILLFFTLVWGFKLRISQVVEKAVEFLGVFYFPVVDAIGTLKIKKAKKNEAYREKLMSLFGLRDEDSQEDEEVAQLEVVKKKSRSRKKDEDSAISNTPTEEPVFDVSEDLSTLDPMEIRKRRDWEREMRRISELNDWELQQRDPSIGGMLSKKNGQTNGIKKGKASKEEELQIESVLEKREDLEDTLEEELVSETQLEAENVEDAVSEEEVSGSSASKTDTEEVEEVEPEPEVVYDDYVVPSIDDILEDPPEQALQYTEEFLKEQARALEEQLANFKVLGKVVGICSGPVIIRYEVELAPGVKVNQVSNLSDDLALALKAKSIRILTPIPGKSAVGIEVPNKKAQIVYIKDVLKDSVFEPEPDTLKLVLGKDIGGEPCVMDLTKAPHLLIAGQTGSGKSVGINSFMASILFSKSPEEVRMILVDPKVVELKPYDSIPHLLAPVVTQPEIAVQALKWSTYEMDQRYNLLAKAGVRNIKGFNQKVRSGALKEKLKESENKCLPLIVIVIDELADLMMVAGKEVETSIARIAQKARAVGIHLILATQRPSTNVITGTIKANLPTRVAFQVASQIDARTIMDKAGCEKLLGRGDMLFRSIDSPEPERIHGSFLDDEQAEAIAKACSEQFVNFPHISTFDVEKAEATESEQDIPRDAKFRDAAELVVSLRQASVSLLQRRMSIGYARSGRIVDQLESAGIVGRDRGSKPREVLMDELELASFLSSGLND